MRVELDEYAHLDSLIHRWEPRSKLVGLLALIFAFAFVEDVRLLPAVVVVTTVLYIASRLPLSVLLKRLRYPGIFLLGIVVVLPFLSGETVIWQWGWLTVRQEGCWAVLLIACRFLAILITGFVLLGTTPFLTLVKAMRSLGLPVILADMTLLSYRYLYEIAGNLATMRQAMRLRGFRSQSKSERFFIPNIGNLRRFASLTGTLFIRSYEQSERIYKAMRLRGYGNARVNHSAIASTPKSFFSDHLSLIAFSITLLTATAFFMTELLLYFSSP